MPTRSSVLLDTNLLVASSYPRDVRHQESVIFFEVYIDRDLIVPAPVLVELYHLLKEHRGYTVALGALTQATNTFEVAALEQADYLRAFQIMRQYRDAELDFTDASIMALAERYGITEFATFDRRDFALVKPAHAEHFTLLP